MRDDHPHADRSLRRRPSRRRPCPCPCPLLLILLAVVLTTQSMVSCNNKKTKTRSVCATLKEGRKGNKGGREGGEEREERQEGKKGRSGRNGKNGKNGKNGTNGKNWRGGGKGGKGRKGRKPEGCSERGLGAGLQTMAGRLGDEPTTISGWSRSRSQGEQSRAEQVGNKSGTYIYRTCVYCTVDSSWFALFVIF